ncbi:MAG: nitroreductase family protein [Anaerolineaceae bacterium]|nr:nitroreductase family protein [Anaerolineaceae bacterium]
MDAIKALMTRRSVRKFRDIEISSENIKLLLAAGMQAPSANNEQPWHFIVIDKRDLMNRITEFHPHAKMLLEARLAIIVCAFVSQEKKWDMWVQDCSAATQNILLAAHITGLGAVWLGVHPRQERINGVKDMFDLPEEIKPFSIIAIGHPAEVVEPVDRFNQEKVHMNKW